jgi:hypothetical protein
MVLNTNLLKTLDFRFINRSIKLDIRNNSNLESIDLSNIPYITGSANPSFRISENPLLKKINLSSLNKIEYLNGYDNNSHISGIQSDTIVLNNLKSIIGQWEFIGNRMNFDNLESASLSSMNIIGINNADLSFNNLINSLGSLTLTGSFDSVNIPKLKEIGGLDLLSSSIKNINLDSVTSIYSLNIDGLPSKQLNFPNLQRINRLVIQQSTLESIRFDNLKEIGDNFFISSKFLLEILEAILIHSNTKVMNTMIYIRFMRNMN